MMTKARQIAGLFIDQKSPNLTKHEDKKSTALRKNTY
jgi:hypothetical protein